MTKTISLEDAQEQLRELACLAESGVQVVLTESGRPVARILRASSSSRTDRIPGLHPGALQPTDDFDAPLPEEYWLEER